MPASRSDCPSPQLIAKLARLELPSDESDLLFDHVETCPDCLESFSGLVEESEGPPGCPLPITEADLDAARTAMEQDPITAVAREIWERHKRSGVTHVDQPALEVPCSLRQYEILRLLDRGGMGEIYEGWHTHLERLVAVKVIRGVRQNDPGACERFQSETVTAGQLEHPNLVRTYDAWEQDGCLFLVQELLDGESLHDLAKQGEVRSVDEVLGAVLGVCQGLEQIHSRQRLHRDVTPSNVMRLTDGTIKLIDYGLAVPLEAGLAHEATRAGTEGFMSPEQEFGMAADTRSDIFSVGRVLAFLLDRLPESQQHGEVHDALRAVAMDCTQDSPDSRPQDVSTLIARLKVLLPEGAGEHVPEGTDRANGRKRTRTVGPQAVLALSLALLMGGVLAWRRPDVPEVPKPAEHARAAVTVVGHEPGDVLGILGPDGTTREIPLEDVTTISLRAGTYGFSLAGVGDRHVSPARVSIGSHPEETLHILAGRPAPARASAPVSVSRKPPPKVTPAPIEIAMTEIPAGSFFMGASDGDKLALADELPRREVVFEKPFRISTHEITVGEFRGFMQATGYVTTAEANGGGWTASRASSMGEHHPALSWENPGYALADTLPVTVVTYEDAEQFCNWLSQRNGSRYRLPTEAEWEYACRAGTQGPYHFAFEARDSHCWSLWNAKDTVRPVPVGSRQPNPWGLFDITGNVREWCLDWYAAAAYATPYSAAPAGPPTGTMRVIRGGSFIDLDSFMRSSRRGYRAPNLATNNQGFRIVEVVAE